MKKEKKKTAKETKEAIRQADLIAMNQILVLIRFLLSIIGAETERDRPSIAKRTDLIF